MPFIMPQRRRRPHVATDCGFSSRIGGDWQVSTDSTVWPNVRRGGYHLRNAGLRLPALPAFLASAFSNGPAKSLGTWAWRSTPAVIINERKGKKRIEKEERCWITQTQGTGICSMTRKYPAPCMIPCHVWSSS